MRDLLHSRLALALLVFFGLQAMEAYVIIGWSAQYLRDIGLTAAAAGLLLGLNQVIGIPLNAVVPALTVARTCSGRCCSSSWPATPSAGSGLWVGAPLPLPGCG